MNIIVETGIEPTIITGNNNTNNIENIAIKNIIVNI